MYRETFSLKNESLSLIFLLISPIGINKGLVYLLCVFIEIPHFSWVKITRVIPISPNTLGCWTPWLYSSLWQWNDYFQPITKLLFKSKSQQNYFCQKFTTMFGYWRCAKIKLVNTKLFVKWYNIQYLLLNFWKYFILGLQP